MSTVKNSEDAEQGSQAASRVSSRADCRAVGVVDNLPADVAITARELEAVENYLGDLLDQLFDRAAADVDHADG